MLSGFGGAGVLELIEDDRGGTYRAVYTVKFSSGIYVLHVFQKKIEVGDQNAATGHELDPGQIEGGGDYACSGYERNGLMTDDVIESSGNVFEDLGFKDSEQELLKARLVLELHLALKERGLTQTEAAELLGTTQPQVSALMRLKPVSVSIGRLMEFLTILGQDVEISVKAAPNARAGKMSFRSDAKAA